MDGVADEAHTSHCSEQPPAAAVPQTRQGEVLSLLQASQTAQEGDLSPHQPDGAARASLGVDAPKAQTRVCSSSQSRATGQCVLPPQAQLMAPQSKRQADQRNSPQEREVGQQLHSRHVQLQEQPRQHQAQDQRLQPEDRGQIQPQTSGTCGQRESQPAAQHGHSHQAAISAGMGSMPHSELLEAMSTARFQRALLNLIGEKKTQEDRCAELQTRLQASEKSSKQSHDQLLSTQAQLHAAEHRAQEAETSLAAMQKTLNTEKARQSMQLKLLEEQASTLQQQVKDKGQQIHGLEERLRKRDAECSSRRAFQESAETLISSFESRLHEVSQLLEAVGKSEGSCKEALQCLKEEQAAQRRQLEACQVAQQQETTRQALERRVKVAERDADAARLLAARRLEALTSTCDRLRESNKRQSELRDDSLSLQQALQRETEHLRAKEQLLGASSSHLNKVLQRNIKLAECNDQLVREALRKEATMQLLLRELSHADSNVSASRQAFVLAQQAHALESEGMRERASKLSSHIQQAQTSSMHQIVQLSERVAQLEGALALEDAQDQTPVGPCAVQQEVGDADRQPSSEDASGPPNTGPPRQESAEPADATTTVADEFREGRASSGTSVGGGSDDQVAHLSSHPCPGATSAAGVRVPTDQQRDISMGSKAIAGSSSDLGGLALDASESEHVATEEPGACTQTAAQLPEGPTRPSDATGHVVSEIFTPGQHEEGSSARGREQYDDAAAGSEAVRDEALRQAGMVDRQGVQRSPTGDGDQSVALCAHCNDVLFGATATCTKCLASFHGQCCQRGTHNLHKAFVCSKCAPSTSRPQKRAKGSASLGLLLQQTSLLS